MGLSRQDTGVSSHSLKPRSPALQVDSLPSEPSGDLRSLKALGSHERVYVGGGHGQMCA